MHRRTSVVAVFLALATGCGAPSPESAPSGWTRVASGSGDLEVHLPPWLVAFDTSGAIFANEVTRDGTRGLQLLAEGPETAELQPAPGDAIETWLAARIDAPGAGVATIEQVTLPARAAVVIRREDRAGTATAWRLVAYAIRASAGVAFLLIDGPPERWAGLEADATAIARLLSLPQARAPATP